MTAVQPADVPVGEVWLVEVNGARRAGVRCDPDDSRPWITVPLDDPLLSAGWRRDDDVTLVRRLLPVPDPAPVATRPAEVPPGQPWTVVVQGVEHLAARCDPGDPTPWRLMDVGGFAPAVWWRDRDITLVAPWQRADQPVEGRRKRELRAELDRLHTERDDLLVRCRELEDQTTRLTGERDEARGERDHAIAEAHQLRDELDTCQLLPADLPSPDATNPAHLRWAGLVCVQLFGPGDSSAETLIEYAAEREAELRVEAAEVQAVAEIIARTGGDVTPLAMAAELVAAARRAREEACR